MSEVNGRELRESRQSLWLLTVSPIIWAGHFLASYITAAVWCAKYGSAGEPMTGVRLAIAIYTLLALGGIAETTRLGWRKHRYGLGSLPHDADTPEDRHRFLGFATVLLSGLSAVATLYVAMVALIIETC